MGIVWFCPTIFLPEGQDDERWSQPIVPENISLEGKECTNIISEELWSLYWSTQSSQNCPACGAASTDFVKKEDEL